MLVCVVLLFMPCVCHAFASVNCCLVVTCWERADLLALVCDVWVCLVTFPCGILGQVWNLIVSIPDLCSLSYFVVCMQQNLSEYDQEIPQSHTGDQPTAW